MNSDLRLLFSREIGTAICNTFATLVYYAQYVTTINFIYRYFGVAWHRPLSRRDYLAMLTILGSIIVAFHVWDYFLTVPTDATELVMTEEYIEIFGGPNVITKTELRTCIRGNMVNSCVTLLENIKIVRMIKNAFDAKLWEYFFFAFMNIMYGLLFYCSFHTFYHVHFHTMPVEMWREYKPK
jgi:hypothetical protein